MAAARGGNFYNFLVVFVAALGSYTYGFNAAGIGNVLALPSFWTYFGLSIGGNAAIVGATTGSFYGGGMIGSGVSFWISNRVGEKKSLLLGSVLGILGGVLQGAAQNIGMFLAGRAIMGVCCGIYQTVVPIYQSEISPPAQRGRMVGSHGFLTCVGSAVAVWIGFGCYFAKDPQVQWRLCLSFTVLSPLLLLVVVPVLPESPRWLISKGKHKKAMKVLRKLHATADDPDELLPKEEFLQITTQIELEKRENQTLKEALKRPSTRKRLVLGLLVPFLIQSTGSPVIANYAVILYATCGITGWLSSLLLCIYLTWATLGNFVNTLIVDKLGRVRMLVTGLTGCSISLILHTTMVAKFAHNGNKTGAAFGIFFLYTFVTFFSFCLDVTGYIYWTEIFPTYARAAGVGVSTVAFLGSAILYTQVGPTAFATIDWKYYLIFIIIPLLGAPVLYLYAPETTMLSLEEISGLFGDAVAMDISHLTTEERRALDDKIAAEGEDDILHNATEDKGTTTIMESVDSK